eukprot:TRINITY_DN2573_c0_g2_i1.p1 TRINITY_DN2573_c0_g2~~TRINITY_DN2573_c0_g2_i1.p1  ORF type:complete len:148 (+),score=28.72 TRINITY_DN2573_c0_g2_i1:70-513(+)
MSGLIEYLKSTSGRVYAAEAIVGLLGAILNFINLLSPAASLNAFLFWTTLIISSGIILLTFYNFMEILRAKFSFLDRAILFYLGFYSLLYLVACIVNLISFGASSIFAFVLFVIYAYHTYITYVGLRSENPAPASTDDVESPAAPKY